MKWTKEQLKQKMWVGTHYYRAPSPPMAEWAADLQKCQEMKMQFVQARVFWNWHERRKGVYIWNDLDLFMDQAKKANLQVVLQLCLENAPRYIFEEYDGFRVDTCGKKIFPDAPAAFYTGGWIPCFDNPEVMKHALEFTAALAVRYRNHPALAFYHAWNEPRSRPVGECCCAHSVKSYQEYLQEQFGTVEELNEKFGKCYASFSDVDAARSAGDFTDMYLWRQWAANRVADRVQKVTEVFKSLDPDRAVMSHVGMAGIVQDPVQDISDDVQTASKVDLYGCSFPLRLMPEFWGYMLVDYLRGVGKGDFTIYELYPSNGMFIREVPPFIVDQYFWMGVARGTTGICFWQFKKERLGAECNDAGLVEISGEDNPVSLQIKQSIAEAAKIPFGRWTFPSSPVVLGYDIQNDLMGRIEVTVPRESDLNGNFPVTFLTCAGYPAKSEQHGMYQLLWDAGFTTDYLPAQYLRQDGIPESCKLLILPAWELMDQELACKLLNWIRQGGVLLVDSHFAMRQSNGWMSGRVPNCGLTDVFGFRAIDRVRNAAITWDMQTAAGTRLTVNYERVTFQLDSPEVEVLARWCDNNTPAVVTRPIGKGRIIAIGATPGNKRDQAMNSYWAEPLKAFSAQLDALSLDAWGNVLQSWISQYCGVTAEAPRGIIRRRCLDENGTPRIFEFRRYEGEHLLSDEQWSSDADQCMIFHPYFKLK